MLNLYWAHDRTIENAYIITVTGNAISEEMSERCLLSCLANGMTPVVWSAYDGTGESIVEPPNMEPSLAMRMLKVTNHYLTKSEVACMLSHISLWMRCVIIDRPIVILEHDAIISTPIKTIDSYGSIVYLGGAEWESGKWPICTIPPHATQGPNVHFICRAHAYAIDPQIAKNLVAHVLNMGIYTSADMMLRSDLFSIVHQGPHAYDLPGETTIVGRKEVGGTQLYNPDLKY